MLVLKSSFSGVPIQAFQISHEVFFLTGMNYRTVLPPPCFPPPYFSASVSKQ